MDASDVRRAITRIAHEILERNKGGGDVVLAGIRTRGAYLAGRLASEIERIEGAAPPTGSLDITLYRADLAGQAPRSIERTDVPDPDGKALVLVDDVFHT